MDERNGRRFAKGFGNGKRLGFARQIHGRQCSKASAKLLRRGVGYRYGLFVRTAESKNGKLIEAARALYTEGPSEREAAAIGLTVEEACGPPVEIWPDNLQAVNVFVAMSTQWRIGMNGPTGLDYGVLPEIWRRTKTPPKDRDAVFNDLRTMEDAALETMRKAKK